MAYSDYGAFVYRNGKRRRDKEDACLFDLEEDRVIHGIMGDGRIRVACYKQYIPEIYENESGEIRQVRFNYKDDFDFGTVYFHYKGYRFRFDSGDICVAEMREPDGAFWSCEYGPGYGAGFEAPDDAAEVIKEEGP